MLKAKTDKHTATGGYLVTGAVIVKLWARDEKLSKAALIAERILRRMRIDLNKICAKEQNGECWVSLEINPDEELERFQQKT